MTALDARAKATGLIAYKAAIDHAIENGLQPPLTLDLRDDALHIWVTGDSAEKWIDSIHVDDTAVVMMIEGRDVLHVTGRLPLLGVKVLIQYSRKSASPSTLRAVRS